MGVHIGVRHHLKKLERGHRCGEGSERFDIHSHGYDIMSYLEMEELGISVHAFRSVADADLFLCVLVACIPTPIDSRTLFPFPERELSMWNLLATESSVHQAQSISHSPHPLRPHLLPIKPCLCDFVPKETSLYVTDFLSCFLATPRLEY